MIIGLISIVLKKYTESTLIEQYADINIEAIGMNILYICLIIFI